MKNNYIKVLDSFNFDECTTKEEIKKMLVNSNHIETIKIMKNYNITQPYDYLRACGKSNFTDFALNKLENRTQEDSKYIISRYINGKVIYLYANNLAEKLEEMNFLVNRGYFDTVKSDNRKIKGYFKDDNEITIGKKSTGKIKILLEEADINSIVKRNYNLVHNNHLNIQGQLGALGIYFGYESKLAKNDKNKNLLGIDLNTVCRATMKDINISNLKSEKSREKIDYIDVIWVAKNNNDLTVAIEIEFKKDWFHAIGRLVSLSVASDYSQKILNIIVSDKEEDYFVIRDTANMDTFKSLPIKFYLAHITVQKLIDILKMRDKGINDELLKEKFFKEINYI